MTSLHVTPELRPAKVATWSEVPDRTPVGAGRRGDRSRRHPPRATTTRCSTAAACTAARCWPTAPSRATTCSAACTGGTTASTPGVSAYNNDEALTKFTSWLDGDDLCVDANEVAAFKMRHPQPFDPDVYQGYFKDPHMVPEEPFVAYIHELAENGLTKTGHHGPVSAMGVSRVGVAHVGRPAVRHRAAGHAPAARRRAGRHRGVHRPQRDAAALARHPDLRVRHELRCAVAGGQDGALQGAPSWPAPASAPARAACCPRSRRPTAATSTSWRRPASAGRSTTCRRCRPSTSRAARAPRPAPAATCPGTRWWAASPRSAACPRARRPSPRHGSPTGTRSTTTRRSPTRCGSGPAASRSASSCRPSTSSATSTRRSPSASTTSSSTAAAAARAPPR